MSRDYFPPPPPFISHAIPSASPTGTAIQDLIARVESLEKRLPLPLTSPASANFYTFRSVEDAETAEKMRNDAILAEREKYVKIASEMECPDEIKHWPAFRLACKLIADEIRGRE